MQINESIDLLEGMPIAYIKPLNSLIISDTHLGYEGQMSAAGTLRRQGKKDLDLQILVSSGIRITNLAMKKGGYLICSDGVPKGKKTYVIKTNENYNPDLNIDLADFIGLFKRREINYQLTNSNNKKMPFEFVSPYSKHQNLSVYRLLIDD